MFNFSKIVKISIYITLVILTINLLSSMSNGFSWVKTAQYFGIGFIYSFTLTCVNAYFYNYISKIYSWEKQPKRRLWIGAVGSILLTIITFALIQAVISILIYGNSVSYFIENETATPYVFALIISVFASLIIHAYYFYKTECNICFHLSNLGTKFPLFAPTLLYL